MIISFSKLGNHGRLGNQLFQIAATYKIAADNNADASFPQWKYQPYFNLQLPSKGFAPDQFKERQFNYEDLKFEKDTDLFGYFQSWKYIPKDFNLKFTDSIRNHWKSHEAFQKETIGIHIRRGDYVGHAMYYQLPISWYISALLTIENWQEKNIIIVSDDLPYCRVHFECLPNAFMIGGSEVDHLCMLSLCNHHIVGNSSFAYWGAWLSEQKHVIHSGKMFRGEFESKDIKDYYPPNWIEFGQEKINLTDVTFTIPVLYDHSDRKKNLDLSLCAIHKYFHTHVIIGEQGEKKFEYMDKWTKYVHFDMPNFHRTKMLNDMALMARTPIIVNWDADIFIPPLQIWLAAEKLRKGAPCVYPYDGRFARMERVQWFRKVENAVDIGVVGKTPLFRRDIKESVGGAVMWRQDAFIDAGMENEYMISYAPEDVERWERMHKLGIKVERIDGTLYHMDHFKGKDSSRLNPFFAESKRLLDTYRAMTADELRQEVDSWPWRHKYTEAYYKRISEGAIRSAKEIYPVISKILLDVRIIVQTGKPDIYPSIIDIGCGVGEWALGNPNYLGVDHNISEKVLLISKEQYINHNLEDDSETDFNYNENYDLCLCLEVAEHISENRADALINLLCRLSNNILFSAAIPNQGGTGHINEQWQEYWAKKFYKNGFGAEICYPVKDNPNVELWYRQNMILYKRGSKGRVYNFVLPEYYEQITTYLKNR